MMIERYDPFRQALGLRQIMDRLLEDAFVSPRALMERMGGEAAPALDVYEEGDNYVVEARLPGMKPEDVDISVEQGVLTISGESKAEEERKERNYLVREQRTGRFSRSIRLPMAVNSDACEATYEGGVLRLTLPKSEQARARRISIKAGGGRQLEGQQAGAGQAQGGEAGMGGAPRPEQGG
jgi:HSP20 family protein